MLREYKEKRDFAITPEPKGRTARSGSNSRSKLSFVVQKHAARRLHYDLRMELGGVLLSWAIPKGIPLDPSEKRMAVMTEDHPLEYRRFEGIIPAPGYGAGEVIIWDQGNYCPMTNGEPDWMTRSKAESLLGKELKAGKISFFLDGEKLTGAWSLVRLKGKEKDWLLIKHDDAFANREIDANTNERSVVSGLTLADLKEGNGRTNHASKQASTKRGGKHKFPSFEPPMLATLTDAPFNKQGWYFEPKLDGIRGLAYIKDGSIQLYSRRGLIITRQYPGLVKQLAELKQNLVLDGEIVALDKNGLPSFQQLQSRSGLTRPQEIALAERRVPVTYYIFDILYRDGEDLRSLALSERKELLAKTIRPKGQIKLIQSLGEDGDVAFQACLTNGLEGIIGKDLDSTYQSGRRSRSWLKVKGTLSSEFLICGFTQGLGARKAAFGSLLMGEHDESGKLVFVGGVGTGLDTKTLTELMSRMQPLITENCAFPVKPSGKLKPTWVKPKLVAEIKFAERTKDGILRAPVFMRLRQDIAPNDVKPTPIIHLQSESKSSKNKKSTGAGATKSMKQADLQQILDALDDERERFNLTIDGCDIHLSNLDRVFWPAQRKEKALTKRDYIRYLVQVSPYVLPHLRDRLLTLIRFPSGIEGQKFYQKHWSDNLPEFVHTVQAYTEHEKRDQDFLLGNNLATLVWLGQIADLELHTSHTRIDPAPDAHSIPLSFTGSLSSIENSLLNFPDYMVFDLDPYLYSGKEAEKAEPELNRKGFRQTCKVALWLKELLDELSLEAFVKTSGKTGLHVYVPIVRDIKYDLVREFSKTVGESLLASHPDEVTMEWSVVKRTGKVFFDHNMNARSKSLASIYSPRVAPEASISTPVDWSELDNVYPTDFTMRTLPERLKQIGDLWADILSHKNDLRKNFLANKKGQPAKSAQSSRRRSTNK